MLRFFLDNVLVQNNPIGGDSLTERLYYSEELTCNLIEVNGTLTFYSTERDYIHAKWLDDTCSIVNIEIQENQPETQLWDTVFKGFIFMSDVTFNDSANSVDVEISDNSFISMIANNRSIEMDLNAAFSKNGVDISAKYTSINASIFTYSPGGGTYNNRLSIHVYEVFSALVAFMTDDQVDFDSSFFADPTLGWTEGNQYVIVSGLELRASGTNLLPKISFQKFYTDLQRVYNLRMGIEIGSGGRPLLRIEPKEYWRGTNQLLIDQIENVQFRRKQGNEFTKILVGNELSTELGLGGIWDVIWNTYKLNEYFLTGQCNLPEQNLDLRMDTLCGDVIVIDDVATGTEERDDDIFIVALAYFAGGANEIWNPYEVYIAGQDYNNKSLANGRIIDRWQDDIYTGVAQNQYAINDIRVEVDTPVTIGAFTDIVFDNDSTNGNFDNGNQYDNLTGIYTCEFSGTYRMRASLIFSVTGGDADFEVGFAFGVDTPPLTAFWFYPGQTIAQTISLLDGESISLEWEYEATALEGQEAGTLFSAIISVQANQTGGAGTLTADQGSIFEILTPASGVFRDFNANEAYSREVLSNGAIPKSLWESIKSDRYCKIQVQGLQRIYQGYNTEIERNILSGASSIKLLSKI